VGLRVPASEEAHGMDLTRHSFSTMGSFSAAGGGGSNAGAGGGKNGGMDAVNRAMMIAHGGDDSSYGASRNGGGEGAWRSHNSSRAASLSGSKHGDMNGGGGAIMSNGKHENAWGYGHNMPAGMGMMSAAEQQQYRARSTAQLFGQTQQPHPRSSSQQAALAEAVTPSVGRPGSGYGFNGGGGGDGRFVGAPVAGAPDLGQPRSRKMGNHQQQQHQHQGWGGGGVHETKSEDHPP